LFSPFSIVVDWTYTTVDASGQTIHSGGGGGNSGTFVGGLGGRTICDSSGSCQSVGGSGVHPPK
jgi:hypothetical protein